MKISQAVTLLKKSKVCATPSLLRQLEREGVVKPLRSGRYRDYSVGHVFRLTTLLSARDKYIAARTKYLTIKGRMTHNKERIK